MKIIKSYQFKHDLSTLCKNFPTVNDDVNIVQKVLAINPLEQSPFSVKLKTIGEMSIIKIRQMASQHFKGKGLNSGFRLIYAYDKENDKIVLIQIYHASQKGKVDQARLAKLEETVSIS